MLIICKRRKDECTLRFTKEESREKFFEGVNLGVSQGVMTEKEANNVFEGIFANEKLHAYLQLGREMESYHDMFMGYDLVSKGRTYESTFKHWKNIHEEANSIARVEFVKDYLIEGVTVSVVTTTYLEDEEPLDLYRKDNKDYYMILSK